MADPFRWPRSKAELSALTLSSGAWCHSWWNPVRRWCWSWMPWLNHSVSFHCSFVFNLVVLMLFLIYPQQHTALSSSSWVFVVSHGIYNVMGWLTSNDALIAEFGVHLAELTVDPQGALAIRQVRQNKKNIFLQVTESPSIWTPFWYYVQDCFDYAVDRNLCMFLHLAQPLLQEQFNQHPVVCLCS